MFGHESKPTRNYVYGILAPTEGADLVDEQLRAAHQYRNNLVRLELDRREAVQQCLLAMRPAVARLTGEVADAVTAYDAAAAALKVRNARERNKRASADERQASKDAADLLKGLRGQLKAVRTEAFAADDVRAALDAIETVFRERRREARGASDVYWGTYLTVEQAAWSFRSGAPPIFHRWTGEGRLAIQLQNGVEPAVLTLGQDKRLRIELTGEYGRGKRGKRPLAVAWFRVGSDGHTPVWAKFPMVYHRPIPVDAKIKWAFVHRRRCGTFWRWQLMLSVARDAWESPITSGGSVGIDLGWRVVPEGLRVASWAGDDGRRGELILPADDLRRWSEPATRRAERDVRFGEFLPRVADWFAANSGRFSEAMRERVKSIRQWKSPARLAGLLRAWGDERVVGDEEIHAELVTWMREDSREWNSEAGQRARASRWRDDYYRCFVKRLAIEYRVVHVEDMDLREIKRKPKAEEAESENQTARGNAFIASPGRLRELIREGFAETMSIDAAWTTQRCHACGEIDGFDAAAELVRTCRHCGVTEDQDYRAAMNLLAGEQPDADEMAGVARGV